jgi:hypothetical protein
MEKKAVITLEDLREIRPLSEQITTQRVNPYIYEAQLLDVSPVLGELFFFDFVTNFDVPAAGSYAVYQELLNGKQYAYSGQQYYYPGLRYAFSYFALARLYSSHAISVDRFGITRKKSDESEPVDPKVLAAEIAELKSLGIAHRGYAKEFLQRNVSSYPLYNYVNESKDINSGSGVKFF